MGIDRWYSEVFTSVNDIEPYLKIEWWDEKDFVMDAGTMYIQSHLRISFIWILIWLNPNISLMKGENRDGYFFPIKQISEKRYKFSFLRLNTC